MKLSIIFLILVMTGCTMAPKFDSVEYQQTVDLRILTEDPIICEDPYSAIEIGIELTDRIHYLRRYSEFSPRNKIFMEMIDEIESIVEEFADAYNTTATGLIPSTHYCKAKMRILERNFITLQQISRRKSEK